MSKNKLAKFAEMENFSIVVQPKDDVYRFKKFEYKGNWAKDFFKNNNPIVLEIGCGRGEYTVALAEINPDINYIGIDIKGARIWSGAKKAIEKNLKNVAFLRTRIDLLDNYFAEDEIYQLWITFPDPQPKKQNKRLTSAYFLNIYRKFVIDGGVINLKTDSRLMHFYTLQLIKENGIIPEIYTDDLYNDNCLDSILCIKTYYERMFLEQGKKITYLKFMLEKDKLFSEIAKFSLNE